METKNPVQKKRLSGVDAAFLYLESEETPLHMAGVFVFDGPIGFRDFVRTVDSRLHLLPTYRQVVVTPPFNVGYPTWEDDPHFDIRRHIHRVHLEAPGGDAELEALTGRILSQLMDRSRPLWDMHVVDGLQEGRGALIVRVHHSLADGITGVAQVFKLMLDPTPEGSLAVRKPRIPVPRRPPSAPSLTGAIASGIGASLQHLIAAGTGALGFAQMLFTDRSALIDAAAALPELVGAVERLPFNKPCSGGRKFCWAEFDLAEVQAIRAAAGGSINDVVLTMLTRAIARYVQLHGQTVVNRLIRVVCPVNLRRDNGEGPGNQIAFMPVVLPMDVKDPVRMLQGVAVRTATMKRTRAVDFITLVANWLGATLPPVQAMMWRGISQVMLPLPLFNIICTNLPGSPEPLYCVGSRMVAFYPQVPTGYELGINCAVGSYCGKLFFGLVADAHVAPDVTRLRDFLYPCFEELCVATGVRKRARRRAARKARPRRAKPADKAAVAGAGRKRSRPAKPVDPAVSVAAAVPDREPEVTGNGRPRRAKPLMRAVSAAAEPAHAAAAPAVVHAKAAQ